MHPNYSSFLMQQEWFDHAEETFHDKHIYIKHVLIMQSFLYNYIYYTYYTHIRPGSPCRNFLVTALGSVGASSSRHREKTEESISLMTSSFPVNDQDRNSKKNRGIYQLNGLLIPCQRPRQKLKVKQRNLSA